MCCFFDIPIGCLAIFLLSLVIKILPTHVTSDTIAGDEFRKTEKPYTLFKIGIFGSLRTNFKSIRKGFIHSSKEDTLAEKWSGFFCFQSFANTSRLWLIINRQIKHRSRVPGDFRQNHDSWETILQLCDRASLNSECPQEEEIQGNGKFRRRRQVQLSLNPRRQNFCRWLLEGK